ncbi:MAG: arginine--tRNA ligase [Deltaproteobacteria bacterium]|nr:arginine--tRNA ligase [Deltaproteobacteria bacterium]MBW2360482.1 arginine--tRNA ligase [Deltaproteobacteria bacterium]
MKEKLQDALFSAVRQVLDAADDAGEVPAFALELPKRADHGDFACNAAMLLAKRLGEPPRAIAERLAAALGDAAGLVERSEIAGPGFLNIWLSAARWQALMRTVLELGPRYGHSKQGDGRRVQVEFVSANPTGPLTLGHGRQGVLGDVLARLLEASGFEVTREYYFNNGGRQMRVLGESVRARALEQLGRAAAPPPEMFEADESDWPTEIDGLPVLFPRDGYQGGYIAVLAEEARARHGDVLDDAALGGDACRVLAQEHIFEDIRATLERMDIHFDVYSNEMDLYEEGKVEAVLQDLRETGNVYDADGAVWLRATALGLERDRVLVKSSGEPTYLLPDLAYHREKFRRGFDRVIDVQGADHIEQFPYVCAGVGALGCPAERIELLMNQFVTLTRGGEQVKQSTRKATYVTVDELIADVGRDVFRFFMIQRKAEGHLDFDLDVAESTDWKKNPAYTVQYAHARTHGIERQAAEQGVPMPNAQSVEAAELVLPEEIELLKKVAEFPAVVARAAESREPHHVAYYAREVAGLWNPYVQDRKRHRVLSEDASLTSGRLGLTLAVRGVLANALALLGLSAPERM